MAPLVIQHPVHGKMFFNDIGLAKYLIDKLSWPSAEGPVAGPVARCKSSTGGSTASPALSFQSVSEPQLPQAFDISTPLASEPDHSISPPCGKPPRVGISSPRTAVSPSFKPRVDIPATLEKLETEREDLAENLEGKRANSMPASSSTPPVTDTASAFYESLLREKPDSLIAVKGLTRDGTKSPPPKPLYRRRR